MSCYLGAHRLRCPSYLSTSLSTEYLRNQVSHTQGNQDLSTDLQNLEQHKLNKFVSFTHTPKHVARRFLAHTPPPVPMKCFYLYESGLLVLKVSVSPPLWDG